MFIKNLRISDSENNIIRDINFGLGLNLIIDETQDTEKKSTGNNVGKTTVLKLIDFCLGANPSIIYTDTENKKSIYKLVKDYLVDNEILITLTLVENLENINSEKVVIERNFLSRKKAIRKINGNLIADKDFEYELMKLLIPQHKDEKPSFRQIISHNIRYKNEHIDNTLKTLDKYTSDIEYETLYLYLLGCKFEDGAKKQVISEKLRQEKIYRDRLEKNQTKSAYEMTLDIIENEISELNNKKSTFSLSINFENDMENLNTIKYKISKISSMLNKLNIRKKLIEESQLEMEQNLSNIDIEHVKLLYNESKLNLFGIQKTFEDLITYHNNMLIEKMKYISLELPELLKNIEIQKKELNYLIQQEKELSERISLGDSYQELEKIISDLNEKYRIKGEYESIINQLNEVYNNIDTLNEENKLMDELLFSDKFESILKVQLKKFNKYFSEISQQLYGEKYALKYDKFTNKQNQSYYKFNSFNANMSSGKKQGEILCFDLAYIIFADDEKIPCLHFLLNDKKELMHDNQLLQMADFVKGKNIQLVISILKDKLPQSLVNRSNIAISLSQESKLFKIEENNKM